MNNDISDHSFERGEYDYKNHIHYRFHYCLLIRDKIKENNLSTKEIAEKAFPGDEERIDILNKIAEFVDNKNCNIFYQIPEYEVLYQFGKVLNITDKEVSKRIVKEKFDREQKIILQFDKDNILPRYKELTAKMLDGNISELEKLELSRIRINFNSKYGILHEKEKKEFPFKERKEVEENYKDIIDILNREKLNSDTIVGFISNALGGKPSKVCKAFNNQKYDDTFTFKEMMYLLRAFGYKLAIVKTEKPLIKRKKENIK
ncbi:MAG: hypothetical protein IJ772_04880 [Bacilli bacterium]|nr:hypothetical protein [Bacilli bacterium]